MPEANAVETNVVTELGVELDAYGASASERTIELNSHAAEAVRNLVDNQSFAEALVNLKAEYEGDKCKTFADAIGYVMYRGFAEIKRSQDAANERKTQSEIRDKQKLYKEMLKANPSLAASPDFVQKMLEALKIA